MREYDSIVIGAGSGGNLGALTLQKSGRKTLLIEKHNITGGTGSSFRRGRFEFDSALHQLYGITDTHLGNKGHLRKVLEDVDVYDDIKFITQTETFRLVVHDKLDIAFPGSYEGFKTLLKRIAPEESAAIDEYQYLCDLVANEFHEMYDTAAQNQAFSQEKFPNLFKYGPIDTIKMLKKYFKNPVLIAAYSTYYGYLGIPVEICPFVDMALCYERGEGTCYVKGGSASMSAAITEKFFSYGGTIKLNSTVEKILVENNKVVGVLCDDGEVIRAKQVLSNVNKVITYTDLIDENYVPESVFADLRVSTPSQSIFVTYIGLDCTAEEAGIEHETNFCRNVPNPTKMFADRYDVNLRTNQLSSVEVTCYNVDNPDASPDGTSIVSILASKNPDWFINCPPEEYFERKDQYLEQILDFVDNYYPKLREHIEEIDCATPVTMMHYLGALDGAVYGLDTHMKDLIANKLELDSPIMGLYFCGASVFVGGFNNSMLSGYYAAKKILNDNKKVANAHAKD